LVAGLEKNEIEGLVSQLLLDIEDQSQKLIKAAQESDQEWIKQSAHALKGVAGSFGAKQLFSFSINIENLCKRGQWEETVSMVSERTPRISEFTCNAYREFLLSRAE